jgi:hypothetical protein
MNTEPIAKNELAKFEREQGLGIVVLGCDVSTPEKDAEYIQQVTDFLITEKCANAGIATPEAMWSSVRKYENKTGRRTDLIFIAAGDVFNVGRLAAVRLQMGQHMKWFDDYMDNGLHNR